MRDSNVHDKKKQGRWSVVCFLSSGLSQQTKEEIRQVRMKKVGELLVILFVVAGCVLASKLTLKKNFHR